MSEPNQPPEGVAGPPHDATAGARRVVEPTVEPKDAATAGEPNLEDLMQQGRAAPDLEHAALAAAEAALLQGQQALSDARAALDGGQRAPARRTSGRELVLRVVLLANLVAMVVVMFLPVPAVPDATATQPHETTPAPELPVEPRPEPRPQVQPPPFDDPVIRAFAAADERDYARAIQLLEDHLAATPRLLPAKKATVLLALEHYAAQLGDFTKAQDYQRRVEALRNSHSLPEDLLQMAAAAERSGDTESMRRHYARLLLQQRQIPSALFRHVAEAYLKLGDSYRQEAEQAAAAARAAELRDLGERLRRQGAEAGK